MRQLGLPVVGTVLPQKIFASAIPNCVRCIELARGDCDVEVVLMLIPHAVEPRTHVVAVLLQRGSRLVWDDKPTGKIDDANLVVGVGFTALLLATSPICSI